MFSCLHDGKQKFLLQGPWLFKHLLVSLLFPSFCAHCYLWFLFLPTTGTLYIYFAWASYSIFPLLCPPSDLVSFCPTGRPPSLTLCQPLQWHHVHLWSFKMSLELTRESYSQQLMKAGLKHCATSQLYQRYTQVYTERFSPLPTTSFHTPFFPTVAKSISEILPKVKTVGRGLEMD